MAQPLPAAAVADFPYGRLIIDSLPLGIVVQDGAGKIVSVNASAQGILGLSLEQLLGLHSVHAAWRAVHEDGSDFPGDSHPAMQALRSGKPVQDVLMGVFNPKISRHTWIKVSAFPILDASGAQVLAVYSIFQDISQQKQAEESLRERDAEFRIAVQTSSDGFWMADPQGRLLETNAAYARLSGYTQEELRQMHIRELDHFDSGDDLSARMERIQHSGHERFAAVHRTKDGRRWPTEVVASYSPVAGGRFFCFIKDLTEQQRSVELIWHQANFDRLTELPNRALFFDRLSQECAAARRNGKQVALLFADLDAFKAVNDRYGHDAGDAVLQTVAARWLSCVRGTDTIARLGGDEFAIIVGHLDNSQEASAIAAKLIQVLGQDIPLPQGASCRVGASVGIALYPDNAVEMDALLQAADKAMYACKAAGKNSFGFSALRASALPEHAPWIAFNESHLVGVAEIDEQHRQLVRMVNELNQEISASTQGETLEARFNALISFTLLHFQTEHRLMVAHQYPGMQAHDFEHGQLASELRLIVQSSRREDGLLVLQKIKNWLLDHIQNADKSLGRFLNARAVY